MEDDVYDVPNLVACAIVDGSGIFGDGLTIQEPDYVLRKNATEGIVEETILIIKNRYSKFVDNPKIASAVDGLAETLSTRFP